MTLHPTPTPVDFVPGDWSRLDIPAHPQALGAAGSEFLTKAFQRFGRLARTNAITAITRIEPVDAGNSGKKCFLSVEYAHHEPGLHTNLFVKFSRDFEDGYRDRRRFELESEVRLASLARDANFPIRVPAVYFADFNGNSGTGILITELVAFGSGGIEPLHLKCMDHLLPDPSGHYRAIITALARLAGAHRSGRLGSAVETQFRFNAAAAAADAPIPWSEAELRRKIEALREFSANYPQLLPPEARDRSFLTQFEDDAINFLRHERIIKQYLSGQADYIALCHWNAHIDNAWFWNDAESGSLQCGLLDWGRVQQMNVVNALWGCLCGATWQLWEEELDDLLQLFVDELHAHGGPMLDRAQLQFQLDLYIAIIGLAHLMDTPHVVLTRLPEAAHASGPLDPVFLKDETARSHLHPLSIYLNYWRRADLPSSLSRLVASNDEGASSSTSQSESHRRAGGSTP